MLEDLDLNVGPLMDDKLNVLEKQLAEARQLRDVFRAPNFEFEWVPIPADGSCLLVATASLLDIEVWAFARL